MDLAEIDIDRIVKNVLEELQCNDAGSSIFESKSATLKKGARSLKEAVQISGRVITADLLSENRGQANEVQLEPRAIITPAARDYIKEHGLKIATGVLSSYSDQQIGKESNPGNWLAIMVQSSELLNSAMDSVSRETQVAWEKESVESVEKAAIRSIDEIRTSGKSGVLIFTDKIATAACLVNRDKSVRGVAVRGLNDFAGLDELDANVVCVPGCGLSFTDYRNLLKSVVAREAVGVVRTMK